MEIPRWWWKELYPDRTWPGLDEGIRHLVEEIQALRLLTDEVVTGVCAQQSYRPVDEIQRAHDIVGQYCVEADDPATMEHVSALCWVLRHDHNTAFAQILEAVEEDLRRRGIRIVRLPNLVDPRTERP
jgi:hypothetical protein